MGNNNTHYKYKQNIAPPFIPVAVSEDIQIHYLSKYKSEVQEHAIPFREKKLKNTKFRRKEVRQKLSDVKRKRMWEDDYVDPKTKIRYGKERYVILAPDGLKDAKEIIPVSKRNDRVWFVKKEDKRPRYVKNFFDDESSETDEEQVIEKKKKEETLEEEIYRLCGFDMDGNPLNGAELDLDDLGLSARENTESARENAESTISQNKNTGRSTKTSELSIGVLEKRTAPEPPTAHDEKPMENSSDHFDSTTTIPSKASQSQLSPSDMNHSNPPLRSSESDGATINSEELTDIESQGDITPSHVQLENSSPGTELVSSEILKTHPSPDILFPATEKNIGELPRDVHTEVAVDNQAKEHEEEEITEIASVEIPTEFPAETSEETPAEISEETQAEIPTEIPTGIPTEIPTEIQENLATESAEILDVTSADHPIEIQAAIPTETPEDLPTSTQDEPSKDEPIETTEDIVRQKLDREKKIQEMLKKGRIELNKKFNFKNASSNLEENEENQSLLEEITEIVMKNHLIIRIEGHTNKGSKPKKYYKSLSLKRAEAISAELQKRGVPSNQIIAKGWGYSKFTEGEDPKRVEIHVHNVGS